MIWRRVELRVYFTLLFDSHLFEVLARAGTKAACYMGNARECPTVNTVIYTTRVEMTSGDKVKDQGETKERHERCTVSSTWTRRGR
jgi:hypothetical protein